MDVAPVIVIAGPTASGKSGLAMTVAEALDGTIVNADSMQVYSDLQVLTARPSAEDEARVPHRLYGYRDAADMASAADWMREALAMIAEIQGEGGRPIVVGGTGLYLRALMEGIAEIPGVPSEIRSQARARHGQIGPDAFYKELEDRDPKIAARLHVGDSQRVLRAWEVFEATGRPLSEWQADPVTVPDMSFHVVKLMPPRDELYAACEQRFDRMLEAGVLDEVWDLAVRAEREGLDPALPIFKALGYPALAAHIRGALSLAAARETAQQQTRNYAKRQMTWLRHQLPENEGSSARNISLLKLSFTDADKVFSFLS